MALLPCAAFLFPSVREGFGPPEITGDHGFYFDSFEPHAMARVLRSGLARTAADPEFLIGAGEYARRFTWTQAARRYADLST